MAHPAAAPSSMLGGLKGAVCNPRGYILPPRSCKYWRDVEFRVYFKRFIWRESKRSEKQFRSLRCLFSSAGAPMPEKQDRIREQSSASLSQSSSSASSSISLLRCTAFFFFFFEKVASNPEQQSAFHSFLFSRSGNRCTVAIVPFPSSPSRFLPLLFFFFFFFFIVCFLPIFFFPLRHSGCVLNVKWRRSSHVCLSE